LLVSSDFDPVREVNDLVLLDTDTNYFTLEHFDITSASRFSEIALQNFVNVL
jgi:hypothetical protein